VDKYTRMCDRKITLSGGEIVHEFGRTFTKPGPTDRSIPDLRYKKTDGAFMNTHFCPDLYISKSFNSFQAIAIQFIWLLMILLFSVRCALSTALVGLSRYRCRYMYKFSSCVTENTASIANQAINAA